MGTRARGRRVCDTLHIRGERQTAYYDRRGRRKGSREARRCLRDICTVILLLVCAALLAAEEKPATQQPIPLSHKTHTAAGVKCLDCHLMRKPGFAAGITCRAGLYGMPHERENGQRCDSEAGGLCEHEKAGPLGAPLSDSRLRIVLACASQRSRHRL